MRNRFGVQKRLKLSLDRNPEWPCIVSSKAENSVVAGAEINIADDDGAIPFTNIATSNVANVIRRIDAGIGQGGYAALPIADYAKFNPVSPNMIPPNSLFCNLENGKLSYKDAKNVIHALV